MAIYIKSCESISAQNTFNTEEFLSEIIPQENDYFLCLKPNYKEYISPKLLRRMSIIIRNAIVASKVCLDKANVKNPDAIIIGTGLGCVTDTAKFLTQLIEGNEQFLNPTAFIQSTHNTIAGKIALFFACHSYNMTYSQKNTSFESALIDAQLKFWSNEAENILVGGIDEINDQSYKLISKLPCANKIVQGEGANLFLLSNKNEDKHSVKLTGVETLNNKDINFKSILAKYKLRIEDIDLIIGGDNSENDNNYQSIKDLFTNSSYIRYKNIIGEYDTASAFGMWVGTKILQTQVIPKALLFNDLNNKDIRNIIIYNNISNIHSVIILSL